MKTTILNDAAEIAELAKRSNQFADLIGSDLPVHRLEMPLLWWQYFSDTGDVDFGAKRGRNLLGKKSWLREPCIIVAEDTNGICGIVPLFVSIVLMDRGEKLKLLSFCPDSVLFFFQDFLVHPDQREQTIHILFQAIEERMAADKLFLFLGHIPSDSPNLPFIQNEIGLRETRGWCWAKSENCIRGGIYPWNIPALVKVLSIVSKTTDIDPSIREEISAHIARLEQQTATLMSFAGTRKKLEEKTNDIMEKCNRLENYNSISCQITNAIAAKPIEYPYLVLPKDETTFFASLSRSKRYYYKRYLKRFAANGGSFERIGPEDIKACDIQEYLELHLKRWGKDSAAVNDKSAAFHEASALTMAKNGYFQLFFAKHCGRRIAAIACFDVGKRREFYYSGRTTYDRKLRAGKLIVMYTILDAIQHGLAVYDFGYGADDYKYDFTDRWRTAKSCFLSPDGHLPDFGKLFTSHECVVVTDR